MDTTSSDSNRARLDARLLSSPGALVKLGCAMINSGEAVKAIALLQSMLSQHPDNPALQSAARKILSYPVPRWHKPMLRDLARNDLYQRAIERAVGPDTRVLDIGTGSGLLAMMAARAGARSVVACEVNPVLAATATEIVAANGYSSQVRVVPSKSTELDRHADLNGGADLIVSEIFSDDLLCEGALPSFDHARRELASPTAQYIPRVASMRVALAYHDSFDFDPLAQVNGFDLSLFDRHVVREHRIPVGSRHLQLRSAPANLLTFDFNSGASPGGGTAAVTLTAEYGEANGVAQWIRLELDEETVYENRPSHGAKSAWDIYFRSLPDGVLKAGGQCEVHVAHDGERAHFW